MTDIILLFKAVFLFLKQLFIDKGKPFEKYFGIMEV